MKNLSTAEFNELKKTFELIEVDEFDHRFNIYRLMYWDCMIYNGRMICLNPLSRKMYKINYLEY